MGKLPYFPFYPDDWISSPAVMLMTMEQRGIYITLLAHAWNFPGGALPDDMNVLQRFCHGAKRKNIQSVLDSCFQRRGHEGGGLAWTNPRLLHERSKAVMKHEKISEASKIREALKKNIKIVPESCQDRGNNQNQNQNQNQNHIKKNLKKEGESKKRFSPPTFTDVTEYCIERKNGIDAIAFVNFYSAKGWMIGKNKMKDWQAAVRTWEAKDGLQDGGSRGNGKQDFAAEREKERFERIGRVCGVSSRVAGNVHGKVTQRERDGALEGSAEEIPEVETPKD